MPTLSSTGNPLPGVKMTPQSGMGCCFFVTSVQCRGPIPRSVLQNMNTTSGKSTPLLEGVPGTGNCCYLQSFPDPHLHSFATQEEDWCLSVLSPPLLFDSPAPGLCTEHLCNLGQQLPALRVRPLGHTALLPNRLHAATEAIPVQQDLSVTKAEAFQKTREYRLSFKLESAEQTGFLPPQSAAVPLNARFGIHHAA